MLRRLSRAPRLARALTLGFALALAYFAIVTAIHSVHHALAEAGEATACPIATASSHLAGTSVDLIGAEPPLLPRLDLTLDDRPAAPAIQSPRPDQGRGPPQVV